MYLTGPFVGQSSLLLLEMKKPPTHAKEESFGFVFSLCNRLPEMQLLGQRILKITIHMTGLLPRHEAADEKQPVLSGKAGQRSKPAMQMRREPSSTEAPSSQR